MYASVYSLVSEMNECIFTALDKDEIMNVAADDQVSIFLHFVILLRCRNDVNWYNRNDCEACLKFHDVAKLIIRY